MAYSRKVQPSSAIKFLADEVVGVVDFAFGKGAVGRAVGERVGERFLVGGNLFALGIAEEVEEADAFEIGRLGGADGCLDLAWGTDLGSTTARSRRIGREGGHGLVAFGLGMAIKPGIEGDFGIEDGCLDAVDFEIRCG